MKYYPNLAASHELNTMDWRGRLPSPSLAVTVELAPPTTLVRVYLTDSGKIVCRGCVENGHHFGDSFELRAGLRHCEGCGESL